MSEGEFLREIDPLLLSLWSGWDITTAERRAWGRALLAYSVRTAREAIERHYTEKSDAYKPVLRSVLALCRELREHPPVDEDRAAWLRWVYRQPKLYELRLDRASWAAERRRSGGSSRLDDRIAMLDAAIKQLSAIWRLWFDGENYRQFPAAFTDAQCEAEVARHRAATLRDVYLLLAEIVARSAGVNMNQHDVRRAHEAWRAGRAIKVKMLSDESDGDDGD